MNSTCYEALINDNSISMMCKSWIWLRTKLFAGERWRRWHGNTKYPFHDPNYAQLELQPPQAILTNEDLKADFYCCCEFWFDCCLLGNVFEIQKDLPNSDCGLGLVSLYNTNYQDLFEALFGLLEFVSDQQFEFLEMNNYPSLYKTQEGDSCIVFGPLSLCNNGRSGNALNQYPTFIDRHFVTDEELMFESMRKQFVDGRYIFALFDHYALRMHVVNNLFIAAGEQIYVDYGFVTEPRLQVNLNV